MNIEDMTIRQAKEIVDLLSRNTQPINNNMIGKYVIVRCHDAGVHAGILESHNGRECVLINSRRLWYWKPADRRSFLSGVAIAGLHNDSKVGASLPRIHLTENCEIIQCTPDAEESITEAKEHVQ